MLLSVSTTEEKIPRDISSFLKRFQCSLKYIYRRYPLSRFVNDCISFGTSNLPYETKFGIVSGIDIKVSNDSTSRLSYQLIK